MEITKILHEVLANKAKLVSVEEIKAGKYGQLVLDMKKAMVENMGVGLAANQVGQDLSILLLMPKPQTLYKVPEAYFNPEITEYSTETDDVEEGCLSIPGFYVGIPAPRKSCSKP